METLAQTEEHVCEAEDVASEVNSEDDTQRSDPFDRLLALASKIGLKEAIALEQIHRCLIEAGEEKLGRLWICKTYQEWHGLLPLGSVRTIQRTFQSLKDRRLIQTEHFESKGKGQRLWITINYGRMPDVQDLEGSVASLASNGPEKRANSADNRYCTLVLYITKLQIDKNRNKYSKDWNKIRDIIAKRDSYICQLCGAQIENSENVHHIDYDKPNTDEKNLLALCPSCHGITNRNREFWQHYFTVRAALRAAVQANALGDTLWAMMTTFAEAVRNRIVAQHELNQLPSSTVQKLLGPQQQVPGNASGQESRGDMQNESHSFLLMAKPPLLPACVSER